MIPIKITCACGQRFAFDAEPINGQLADPVLCPVCGGDGTTLANEFLRQNLAAQPVPPTPPAPLFPTSVLKIPSARPANVMAASALHTSQLGMVDREQATIEARAKVSWGDSPAAILQYLMIQRFSHAEATELVTVLFKERSAEVRMRGMKKVFMGGGMIVGAVGSLLYMFAIKFLIAKLVGLLIALALWGLWILINGAIMAVAPKTQSGDVAEA